MQNKEDTTYKIDTIYFRGIISFINNKFQHFSLEKKEIKSIESTEKGSLIFETDNLLEISHLKSIIDDVMKYSNFENQDNAK